MAEFAPGLPSKSRITNPPKVADTTWPMAVQEHHAERAGRHLDLRLGNPDSGVGHSWVIRRWPEPGQKVLAIQQPDHTLDYFSFTGRIPSGYGAGVVKKYRAEDVEIVSSSPEKVTFNAYPGKNTEEYSLIRTMGNKWLLINKTPTKAAKIPQSKPKYREIKPNEVDFDSPTIMQAKLDGAHVTTLLKKNQPVRVFSYRPSKKSPLPIQHTDRIPGLRYVRAPAELDDTVVRGELVAMRPNRKALPAHKLGGILNSNVWKSRKKQLGRGILQNYIFDVVRYRGVPVDNKNYEEKRKILNKIVSAMPDTFRLPPEASTPEQKRKLFEMIKKNKLPETKEGVVLWDPASSRPATKVKFKPEYDVRISGIFTKARSKAREEAGGIIFDQVQGKRVKASRIGTGFSQALKKDMFKNPKKYIGLIARISAMEQHSSGALRSGSFQGFHQDKNPQERLPRIGK